MLDEIRSVLRPVVGGAERLRNVLALSDASTKLLRFILMMFGVVRGFVG
jgi:hypothetical protein